MDGQINPAYVSDHGEGLDYGSLDDTLDIEFYRSKLVIDFSKIDFLHQKGLPICNIYSEYWGLIMS